MVLGHFADKTIEADAFEASDHETPALHVTLATSPVFAAKAAIWQEFHGGLISLKEAEWRSGQIGADHGESHAPRQRGRAYPPALRPRSLRPSPKASRQYANPIATTAMRDDRLTPGAKALLVVLRARAGKGRVSQAAKSTLAAVMSRSTRTIRRYLHDLERLGYITTQIRRTAQGFHTGLIITLSDKVLPFFTESKALGSWLAERTKRLADCVAGPETSHQNLISITGESQANRAQRGPFGLAQGMTVLSPINHFYKEPSFERSMGRENTVRFRDKGRS